MYYYLIQALKRRLILELQDSFSAHPVYSKIVPFIQTKYAFTERPQFGIVVKGASANKVALSADNFIGTVVSYVMLAYVGAPVYPIEWVREDGTGLQEHGDRMPTAPGVYYLEILTAPTNPQEPGTYVIDPLITVTDEAVLHFMSGIEREAQLQNLPLKGTVRLWENRHNLLVEGQDFRVDYQTGAITILSSFKPNATLTADYRYAMPSIGPVDFYWNQTDAKTLPGVVMAFGKRAKEGDKVGIVVYGERVETPQAYGGKFEASFDFDVISQDTNQMEEIADLVVMYLWGVKRAALGYEGIEIVDISLGGEAEETYDETADIYFYNASVSIQFRADWELHVPMPLVVSKATPTNAKGEPTVIGGPASNLFLATSPIIAGRNNQFERIT